MTCLLYVLLVFPETLSPEMRKEQSCWALVPNVAANMLWRSKTYAWLSVILCFTAVCDSAGALPSYLQLSLGLELSSSPAEDQRGGYFNWSLPAGRS